MMSNDDLTGAAPEADADETTRRPGERLAKAIARAGLGSRREAEGWIAEGRVTVNGAKAETAALNVLPTDRVEVDGRALPARERTRLWLYHKPRGYVTTTHDPEGRETVFSILPPDMPRVVTIGRLDINTEGLLLLTNDGGLARVLELPETGWLRRYRVRAFGRANPEAVLALKDGVTIDDFAYGAIDAEIERQNNDNVWMKFGLREGKNREVKRVAEHLGLSVNRLIRISFGPFQLGQLAEGAVEEVRTRTLKDQLGKRLAEEAGCDFEADAASFGEDAPRVTGGRGSGRSAASAPRAPRNRLADPSERVGRRAPIARPRDAAAPAASAGEGERPVRTARAPAIADRRGRSVKVERVARDAADVAPKRVRRADPGAAERFGAVGRPPRPGPTSDARDAGAPRRGSSPRPPRRQDGGADARAPRGDRPFRTERPRDGARPERRERPAGERPAYEPRGDRPFRSERPRDDARPDRRDRAPRERSAGSDAERPRPAARSSEPRWRDDARATGDRAGGDRKTFGDRKPFGERKSFGERKPSGDRPRGDRPARHGAERERKPFSDRPRGDRPDRAGTDRAGPERDRRPRDAGASGGSARPQRERPAGDRPAGDRPARSGPDKPRGGAGGFKPRGPGGGKPGGGRPGGGKGRPGGADRRR